jgi:chromosome segregation ATPase
MTDTDITALAKRLRVEWGVRKSSPRDYDDEITDMMADAADALEACQAERDQIKADFNDCNSERAYWKVRAKKAERHVEELQEKVDADTSCACSYDAPGDVCLSHSPALKAALARAEKAEAEVEHQRREQKYWYDRYAELGGRRAEKAEAALERRIADINHLDVKLADTLDRAEKAERHVEELQEKVDADTSCACSYDNPGDVCLSHSPALKAALARAEKAEAALAAVSPRTTR